MKYCEKCCHWMIDEYVYCTECGNRLQNKDYGYRTPGEDIDIDINFYKVTLATVANNGQSFEITLCTVNDEDAQLDIYTRNSETSPEIRKTYTVDRSTVDRCYEAIDATDVRNWHKRDDCHGMMGARYVLKFRENDRLTRVSTDHCPPKETSIFFTIENILRCAVRKEKKYE